MGNGVETTPERLQDVAYSELLLPRDAAGEAGFRAWRDTLDLLYKVELEKPLEGDFEGCQKAWHLDLIVLGETRSPHPQRLIRDIHRTANPTGEYYLVQLSRGAGAEGRVGSGTYRFERGDISIIDLGLPSSTREAGIDTLDVLMPRTWLEPRISGLCDMGSMILPRASVQNRLLACHLQALHATLAEISVDEARRASLGTLELFAALVEPRAGLSPQSARMAGEALHSEIVRYINVRLDDSSLGGDEICERFRVSRTFLYNLLRPEGGVTAFIRKRRLERCRQALADPANRNQRVIDIAMRCGFNNESHFSRVFRDQFGVSPSEARHGRLRPAPRGPVDGNALLPDMEAWLRRL